MIGTRGLFFPYSGRTDQGCRKEGVTGFPVHIKLDTGMHRLGFDPEMIWKN